MYSGFYTLASGILTRQNEIDVIGNNITNIKTPGYKTDRVETSSFEMELMVRMENGDPTVLGDGVGHAATIVQDIHTIMDPGIIEQTDRELDIAINGDGFFNVRTPDGQTADPSASRGGKRQALRHGQPWGFDQCAGGCGRGTERHLRQYFTQIKISKK